MRELSSEQVTTRLLLGLDLLALALLVMAVTRPLPPFWPGWLAAAAFAASWVVTRRSTPLVDVPMEARGAWWPGGALMLVLLGCYVWLLFASASAMWLAFPLMVLQMHVLGPARGAVAVTVTTVAATGPGAILHGATGIGYVLGPVVGALVAVATVTGLESLTRVVQDRQRALDDLRAARQQVADAEREWLRADERERLARDIHDTLAQDFAAIDLHLRRVASLEPADSAARAAIMAAQRATSDGLAQARRFIAGRPDEVPGDSLLAALRRAAARTVADSDDRTRVEVRSTGQERPLPAPITTTLIRLAQSALSNVVRHADATEAVVTLTWEPDRVLLDVVDDGIGFVPDLALSPGATVGGTGFGLSAMRARVAELKGTVGIESAPGEGTAIAVILPTGPGGTP